MKTKQIIIVLVLIAISKTSLACQYVCTNCTVTNIRTDNTGSALITFSSATNENPDSCGTVGKVLIDVNKEGAKELYAGILSARLTNTTLSKVRSCGCADEWGTNYPSLSWFNL